MKSLNASALFSVTIICLTLSFISPGRAQNLRKAIAKIETKNFNDAKEIFSKSIKKKKDPVVAKYGLALVYANDEYPKKNFGKAYRNIKYCLKRWDKLSEKEQLEYEEKYQLTFKSLIQMDSLLQMKAYQAFLKAPTQGNREKFEKDFKDAPVVFRMKSQMAVQEYKQIKSERDPRKIDAFIRRYPNTPVSDSADVLSKLMWRRLYDQFRFDGVIESISTFEKSFPGHRVPQDTIVADKELAVDASELLLHKGYYPSFVDKYKDYIRKAGHKHTIAYVALQRILSPYIAEKKWGEAKVIISELEPFFRKEDARIRSLKKNVNQSSMTLKIERLNDSVNTNKSEYVPIISANGKELYFCGFNRSDAIGQEDIYLSLFEFGEWQKPAPIKELCTPTGYEAPLAISTDGNTLIYFQNRHLFFSKKTQEGWSQPSRFSEPINSKYWQGEAQMTSDGKNLIFVSDRAGGQGLYNQANRDYHGGSYGNIDIYVSEKKGPNSWGKPINLGKVVNTPFCERGIFLHPDMKTLYFSSDGHGGLGGLDIYKTTRLNEDSWTEWSEPENLGKSINTAVDDWGYRITTDGTQAFFSAQEKGSYDLYVMDLPESIRPNFIATISGYLLDNDGNPISGTIKWEDLKTGKPIGQAESNPIDGSYFLVVQLGKNYGYYVDKEGYFPSSSNIDLRNQKTSINVKHDIILQSWEEMSAGKPVRLNNLFFDTGSYELKPESFPELNRLAKLLIRKKDLNLEIRGHTDNQGGKKNNQTLSENRAKAVRDFLVEKGAKNDRLSVKGFGQEKPLAPNSNAKGRAQNRRVEIKVLQ